MRSPEKTYREKENGSKTASWKRVIVQGIGRGQKRGENKGFQSDYLCVFFEHVK